LKQDATTIEAVTEAFQLTVAERQYLMGANKGEGLLFARGARLQLTIEASPAEHRLATTAPRELAELAELAYRETGPNGVAHAHRT
jgi:hypothetical protein